MNRRDFVNTSLATSAFLPTGKLMASSKAATVAAPGYSLKILATNWGYQGTVEELCAAVKKEGYDGLELWWSDNPENRKATFAALEKHDLEVGFLCGANQREFAAHLDSFKKSIDAASTQKEIKPLYINCHSGRDYFSYEQNKAIIDHTVQASKRSGIPIFHETHRSRMLFAAHVARHFIEQNPDLRITLDISHWCNVHESLLKDQPEAVALALSRAGHIHARVGHPEGPQVSDPRAPEWADALAAHLGWWDRIVQDKKSAGQPLTILTEFGPPNYLPTLPYTKQPVVDQWAINVYMMQFLQARYA